MAHSVVRDRGVLTKLAGEVEMGRQYTKRLRKMKKDRGGTELGEKRRSLHRFTESKWK